ncbi:MAG: hypothetical protein JWR16_264 [Nevskia sp.]|nr:hypothetical protein [Nevskia sp.]
MAIVYHSADFEAKDRFESWREVIYQHFFPADGEVGSPQAFNAQMQTRMLGMTSVSRISASAHAWVRNADHLRRTPHDEFLLSLMLKGEGRLKQGDREVRQRAGVMVLYDTGQTYSYQFAADIVVLKIPRRLLLARVPDAIRLTALPLRADSPVGALASSVMRQAAALDIPADAPAAPRIGASLLDVVAATLDTELSGRERPCSKQTALLERVRNYIRANIGDSRLDVESIAHASDISPRTLNRLFAITGTTPMRWVWKQRLEASYCLLSEGRMKRVTDVAFNFGFNDLSHFSRTFKNEYGVSPHSLNKPQRPAALGGACRNTG